MPHHGALSQHRCLSMQVCCLRKHTTAWAPPLKQDTRCRLRDGLRTHIAHQSLEDNKLCLELLHLHGQFFLARFSLLGFLHPGQKETCTSARGSWGAGERGGDAHLLQLSDSVLKLDTHCVLLFPSRERNVPVRSHLPRIAGCWREPSGSCSPQSYPRGGEGGSRVGGRTCPGMHCHLFPGSHSCQMPVSPPGHKPSSTTLFADLTLGWPAAPVVGGAGDTNRRLRAAAATRGNGL